MNRSGKKHAITERFAERAKVPTSGYVLYKDGTMPGFALRVNANGSRSFILNYTINGRGRRLRLGEWSPAYLAQHARADAEQRIAEIRKGIDPLETKAALRTAPLVMDLAEEYMQFTAAYKRPNSRRNDRQMLDKNILPAFGKLRVNQVTKRDVERLHGSLHMTPYCGNRVLSLIKHMFHKAVEWGFCESNPANGVTKHHEDRRETWLRIDQLRALSDAIDDYVGEDPNVPDAIRLLVLTGAREMEVVRATWDQFDLKRGVWTKPSHHVKEKRIEHVPLNKTAQQVLARLHTRTGRGRFLFPGAIDGQPRATIRRPWEQVLRAAGLATPVQVVGKRMLRNKITGQLEQRMLTKWKPTIRVHDLRHTFASQLVNEGKSLLLVGRLLGHTQSSTTERYSHVDDKSLRDAANAFPKLALAPR